MLPEDDYEGLSEEDIARIMRATRVGFAALPPKEIVRSARAAKKISAHSLADEERVQRDALEKAQKLISLHPGPEELAAIFTEWKIGLQWLYTAKAFGFQDVIKASDKGSPYYVYRHEKWVLEQHKFLMKDTHYIGIGEAEGEKPELLTKLYGPAAHYTLFDVSADYLNKTRARLIAAGVSPDAITCYVADYTSDKFWPLLDRVIKGSNGRIVTLNAYGNEINNESMAWFLNKARPILPPKSQVRIGGDNTQHEKTLMDCYLDTDFARWQTESAAAVIRDDAGYDLKRPLIWEPTLESHDGFKRIGLNVIIEAGNELTRNVRMPGKLRGLLPQRMEFTEAKTIVTGYSDRYLPERNLEVVHEAGFKMSSDYPDQPLRVKDRHGDSNKIDCNIIVVEPSFA